MNELDVSSARQKLLSLKSELEDIEETSRESGYTVELDQTKVGRLSRMDALQVQQMAIETEHRRKQQLKAIEGALKRIENGDYGYCYYCDGPIGDKRLSVNPAITRCLNCADL